MKESCLFHSVYGDECVHERHALSSSGPSRIQSIIHASKVYNDGLYVDLESKIAENPDLTIKCHRNCVSRYTSKTNLAKYHLHPTSSEQGPSKKKSRKCHGSFHFKRDCIYCGQICNVEKDKKNPSRWHPAFVCRSTHANDGQLYKEFLLERCTSRNGDWAQEVQLRLQGAVSDLHAVEARYHRDCMSVFLSNRKLSEDSDSADAKLNCMRSIPNVPA